MTLPGIGGCLDKESLSDAHILLLQMNIVPGWKMRISLGRRAFEINWKPQGCAYARVFICVRVTLHKLCPSACGVAVREAGSTLASPFTVSSLAGLGARPLTAFLL